MEERLARLNSLKEQLLGPGDLGEKLKSITDAVVEVFGADFAASGFSMRAISARGVAATPRLPRGRTSAATEAIACAWWPARDATPLSTAAIAEYLWTAIR